jgi:chloride channel protein, CIC family
MSTHVLLPSPCSRRNFAAPRGRAGISGRDWPFGPTGDDNARPVSLLNRRGETAEQASLLIWAAFVGLAGGAAALVLRYAAIALSRLVWGAGDDLVRAVQAAGTLSRLVVPVAGALLAGLVLALGERWSGASRGWDILEAVLLRGGALPARATIVKAISSLVTVSSASPVGREGPIVLAAATVSSSLGERFSLPTRHRRLLTGCGVATGLACAYNAPVGAALFTMEIVFGSLALETFVPLVMSSVVATLLTRAVFGDAPVFRVPALTMVSAWEAVLYALLGVLGGVLAGAFLVALRRSADLFRRLALPRPLAMALVGLVLGVVIQWYPEIVGNGREAIADLFQRDWPLGHVLALLLLRLVLTPLAVGSGAVGGVFTPTLFLGAMLGYGFGSIAHLAVTGAAPPAAYALAGMGALLAGTTHAPLTSVLMVFEMTLDYSLVVPLLLASAASTLVARALVRESVYTEALRRKARTEDLRAAPVLGVLTAGDVMRHDQITVPADLAVPDLLDRFVASRRNHLYVTDAEGRFRGAVNLHDLNRVLLGGSSASGGRASDLARSSFEATFPGERLDQVLERFSRQESERLPVLDDPDSRRLVGTVSKRDILGLYSRELLQRGPRLRAAEVEAPVARLMEEVPVPAELVGLSTTDARLPERYGVSLLMVRRGDGAWLIPDPMTRLEADDRLAVFGPADRLEALRRLGEG